MVGAYLQKASLESGFTLEQLNADPEITVRFNAFRQKCLDLGTLLLELGAGNLLRVCGGVDPPSGQAPGGGQAASTRTDRP